MLTWAVHGCVHLPHVLVQGVAPQGEADGEDGRLGELGADLLDRLVDVGGVGLTEYLGGRQRHPPTTPATEEWMGDWLTKDGR